MSSVDDFTDSIRRWFLILLCCAGAIASLGVIVTSLSSGATPTPFGRGFSGPTWTLAHAPSQFWFALVLYAACAALFAWGAWRIYRN